MPDNGHISLAATPSLATRAYRKHLRQPIRVHPGKFRASQATALAECIHHFLLLPHPTPLCPLFGAYPRRLILSQNEALACTGFRRPRFRRRNRIDGTAVPPLEVFLEVHLEFWFRTRRSG